MHPSQDGFPEPGAKPTATADEFLRRLRASGLLSKEQLAESLQHMEDRGCRQGEAFIEMGLMTFPQLVMVLGKQVEFILQQIMQERNAKWAFYPLDNLPEQFLPPPLRVPSLLYRGLVGHAKEMRGSELAATHARRGAAATATLAALILIVIGPGRAQGRECGHQRDGQKV